MVRRSFQRWRDLERQVGRPLLTRCGCLNLGPNDGGVIAGVRQSARQHGLNVEELSSDAIRGRFPAFQLPDHFHGILEHEAGFLRVEDCVLAHAEAATNLGAKILPGVKVREWSANSDEVQVRTDRDTHRADRLIITAGPWALSLLGRFGETLRIMRQTMLWFQTSDDSLFQRDRFPIYLAETSGGYFYGLPVIDAAGHKVARHYGQPELLSPEGISREVTEEDERPVREFLNQLLPLVDGPRHRGEVCLYTLTPDRHFIIDRHPEHDRVAVAAGFSGHGFKFAPVVGEIMADLALDGQTAWPIDMFRITRFS